MGVAFADTVLSAIYHSLYATLVPLYTYLLTICKRSDTKAWTFQGFVFSHMAHPAL
jgi:hypothetical protein